jgi:hypothetical protein
MVHPLDGVRAKLERANDHLTDLGQRIAEWHKTYMYRVRADLNPKSGECVLRLTNVKQPPLTMGVIIGEFTHDLRSALDHIVCALATLNWSYTIPHL